jgi:two-component system response regulator GlrR
MHFEKAFTFLKKTRSLKRCLKVCKFRFRDFKCSRGTQMESLTISLIDLSRTLPSPFARELRAILQTDDDRVRLHEPAQSLLEKKTPDLGERPPDVIILILPEQVGEHERAQIRTFSGEPATTPLIAVIEQAKTDEMIELFKLGITDFITPPFKTLDVMPRVWRLAEHVRKKKSLTERLKERIGLRQIIGSSPVFLAEQQKVPFVANCDSSVLLLGETGTGKEMFARSIHYLGPRAGKPFTPVNCGAIPGDLLENELFGHAKGAYTNAAAASNGLIQETDGGTLFLDEIDSLTTAAQVKLLRFLQEKEYRQLGSAKTLRADVRIIAATNIDLEQAVGSGSFRRDLYYRLNIIPMTLPPLRERREDIPLLTRHFVDQYVLEFNKKVDDLEPEVLQMLFLYDWPGNVRELQNIIERAVVFSSGPVLRSKDILLPRAETSPPAESFQQAKARVVVEFEKNYINNLLISHRGNITKAAKTAGKNRRAFWELMRKHEISTGEFKHSE